MNLRTFALLSKSLTALARHRRSSAAGSVATAVPMLLVLLAPASLLAGIGDVDPAFGNNGRVQGAASLLPDGRMLRWSGTGCERLDSLGRPDTSFGIQGFQSWPQKFDPNWDAWLRLDDGSFLVGGSRSGIAAVLHLDASGSLDGSFGDNGVLAIKPRLFGGSSVVDLAQQPDGRLLVLAGEYGGNYYYADGPTALYVHRFEPSLAIDTGFGVAGAVEVADYRINYDSGMLETSGQRLSILASGMIEILDGYPAATGFPSNISPKLRVTHVSGDGVPSQPPVPDPTLGVAMSEWRIVARLPDGAMLLEWFGTSVGGTYYRLARLRADGQPDPAFGESGKFAFREDGNGIPVARSLSADGRFFYVALESETRTRVLRLSVQGTASGRLDATFGEGGVVTIRAQLGLAGLQGVSDGSVLLRTSGAAVIRLLPVPLPSPGLISFQSGYAGVDPHDKAEIRVTRSAGSDGDVSADFRTADLLDSAESRAVSGKDYVATTGHLAWADGDAGDRLISIPLLPGFAVVNSWGKAFAVQLDNSHGVVGFPFPGQVVYAVLPPPVNTVESPSNPAPSAGGNRAGNPVQGGGGTLGLLCLSLISIFLGFRVCRRRTAVPHRWSGR